MTTDTTTAPELLSATGPLADIMRMALELPEFTPGRRNLLRAIAKARADLCRAPVAHDGQPVAWGESYNNGASLCSVSLTKSAHHAYPLIHAHPAPQPSDEAAEAERQAALRLQQVELVARAEKEAATLRDENERLKAECKRISNEAVKMLNENATNYDRMTNEMVDRHANTIATLRAQLAAAENRGETWESATHTAQNKYFEMVDTVKKLTTRAEAAEAALAAAEDHADVLAGTRGALEGATNWLDALLTLIVETSCDPEDEAHFDEIILCANLAMQAGREALAAHQARRAGE